MTSFVGWCLLPPPFYSDIQRHPISTIKTKNRNAATTSSQKTFPEKSSEKIFKNSEKTLDK